MIFEGFVSPNLFPKTGTLNVNNAAGEEYNGKWENYKKNG